MVLAKYKYKKILWWVFLFLLVVFLVVIRLVQNIGYDKKPSERFIIKRVIDGDTIELQGGDRLRLLAIDTPEKNEPFYQKAKDFVSRVALGKTARIVYSNRRRDHYGRLLGYLYVDTLFVNKIILENGLGYLYLFKDNNLNSPEVKELLTAQRNAIHNHRGLWSLPREPEAYYININGSFRFHRPGCRVVSRIKPGHYRIFKTREEALLEGLSPCRICKP